MAVLLILLTFLSFSFAKVYYAKWEDAVSPIMVEYIKRNLAKAEKEGAGVFI
jgi:membrane-bound serine protease (ClpP class)